MFAPYPTWQQQPPCSKSSSTDDSNLMIARKAISVFVDQNHLHAQQELEEREKIVKESLQQLEEAKQIVPALFAKPGDKFVYRGTNLNITRLNNYGSTYLVYVGRNETPSVPLEHFTRMYLKQYKTPELGWLVFQWIGGERVDAGLRGACNAWPKECYQHYDAQGCAVRETLCIPPSMCGMLRKYTEEDSNE